MLRPKIRPRKLNRIPIISSLCPLIAPWKKLTLLRSGSFSAASPAGSASAAREVNRVKARTATPCAFLRHRKVRLRESHCVIQIPPRLNSLRVIATHFSLTHRRPRQAGYCLLGHTNRCVRACRTAADSGARQPNPKRASTSRNVEVWPRWVSHGSHLRRPDKPNLPGEPRGPRPAIHKLYVYADRASLYHPGSFRPSKSKAFGRSPWPLLYPFSATSFSGSAAPVPLFS